MKTRSSVCARTQTATRAHAAHANRISRSPFNPQPPPLTFVVEDLRTSSPKTRTRRTRTAFVGRFLRRAPRPATHVRRKLKLSRRDRLGTTLALTRVGAGVFRPAD